MNFRFDKSVIYRARLFTYMGLNGIVSQPQSTTLFREFAGKFNIIDSKTENDKIIFTLGMETISQGDLKFIAGQEENVAYTEETSYSFHTHPISSYLKYNWIISTPSSPDFKAIFVKAIKKIYYFHAVISMEGIYIISLSEYFINQNKNNFETILNNTQDTYFNKYEYPIVNRAISSFNSITKELQAEHINKYIKWLDNVNSENIFQLQFYFWNDLMKNNNVIQIHYANINNACYAISEL